MSVELEEADLPLTEAEEAPLAPEKKAASKKAKGGGGSSLSPSKKKKNNKKKNQPGKYSQLVVETIRKLGERNGSSLAKIYNEAKKVAWFDQQNGRTYLKYSIKALVQNDTLLQVKGTGANGSFKLNKKKLEGGGEGAAGRGAHNRGLLTAASAPPEQQRGCVHPRARGDPGASESGALRAHRPPARAARRASSAGGGETQHARQHSIRNQFNQESRRRLRAAGKPLCVTPEPQAQPAPLLLTPHPFNKHCSS
ncbi:PREDICTED: histone H1x [Tinamus guttatus]|uniref:histone H1x n=1 Tax=Tinamus guttatus TaxID=94827 RepID=UPI00052EA6F3|nr:PREDICTED: histone H1x [Tinamus guttatus]